MSLGKQIIQNSINIRESSPVERAWPGGAGPHHPSPPAPPPPHAAGDPAATSAPATTMSNSNKMYRQSLTCIYLIHLTRNYKDAMRTKPSMTTPYKMIYVFVNNELDG